jgi:hypothetical protein
MDWVRTSEVGVEKTIKALVDYHISITSDPESVPNRPSSLGLRRSWTEPDIYKPELYSTLAPYVKHWANQPDLTYLVVLEMEIVQSAKFQEIMDKLLRSMTTTFTKNLEKIFTFFEPGGVQ